MHKFNCLKQDQRPLIYIRISLLCHFVDGHLVFLVVFFFPQSPQKRRTGLHLLLPVHLNTFQPIFAPTHYFSEGQKSHQFCQVSSLGYCHFVQVMSSEISLRAFLPSPAPSAVFFFPFCLFFFFLSNPL